MKKSIWYALAGFGFAAMFFSVVAFKPSQEKKISFTQITTIESVVPGGMGRSRMIMTDPAGNYSEMEMDNFFSLVGINFANVRKNDKTITEKINLMTSQGWTLANVNSGVYGADKSTGIFITRYLFRKEE